MSLLHVYSKNRSKRETAASFYQCAETINHRRKHEFIISLGFLTRSAAVSFRPCAHRRSRRNTKTTIYDCRRSRSELILPDFTSAPSNPTDRSLRLFCFFSSPRLLLSCSHQDETERIPAQRLALPFACITKKSGSVLDNYCAHGGCVKREGRR